MKKTFFGPFSVSVLSDGNGSNTTAAAAVLTALEASGGSLEGARVLALAATGPVGQRIARLLGRLGATVALGSRDLARAHELATRLRSTTGGDVIPFEMTRPDRLARELQSRVDRHQRGPAGRSALAGGALAESARSQGLDRPQRRPSAGNRGRRGHRQGQGAHGVLAWGALGVGGTKMKIHKNAITQLFAASNLVLDAEEVLELGRSMVS